ncbi:GNAT family N-acetyltransferase [Cytobacillus praedii]|uniref:GNAT family N-acetyltransferase n=1 Tax=Cytobacillus praedii TaxID=1742358 RepID=A0A4R1AZN2_9BACI|nr:GNAT family N-acetyltransferase [Cytobacillus praedii]TCJ03192.1 GNAT family N-acetyltransferase [Cytobacillus praedii]
MEGNIRKLEKEEFPSFVEIVVNAYPGTTKNTAEFKQKYVDSLVSIQEKVDTVHFYGLFRKDQLIGGMRIHHFTMNVYGKLIEAGGVGLVAVDLLHKKEKAAKDLIDYFISYFKEKGNSIVMLYPFRPDFYKNMGFGYGTKMNQYQIEPVSFPKAATKEGLMYLDSSHQELIKSCANRFARSTHGMILKTDHDLDILFKNPDHKLVGFMENGELQGYIVFTFKNAYNENFLMNNLIVKEFIYETPKALTQLCHCLHTQADQVNRIILNTPDDDIEFLISESRNGSNHLIPSVYHETKTSGIGLMYKIIDVPKFLLHLPAEHFPEKAYKLGLIVRDTFHSDESQKWMLSFEKGKLTVDEHVLNSTDVELELDISDLSSMAMGAVSADKLYQYGRLNINKPEDLAVIKRLFSYLQKPTCTKAF